MTTATEPAQAIERRPVMLTVDDDPGVSRAVQRDLRRRYGERFRVLRAESGGQALDLLQQVRLREDPVALMVVDQRMPEMSGVQLLEASLGLHPMAKRVLLTAYADTQAAIDAINRVGLDRYLMKPWDPPEEQLYPVIDDLLTDWEADLEAGGGDAIRIVGHRYSPASHEVRDFLARNGVPYVWLDVERDADAQALVTAAGADPERLPLIVFPDGGTLARPQQVELAERIGVRTRAEAPFYDLVVVGAGPAGLAAAVYGASEGLRTALVEREVPGGQAGQSSRIENYLGFPVGLSGRDLTSRATAQAQRLGAEIISVSEVVALETEGPARSVRLADGGALAAHAVVLATGVQYRRLEAPGADRLAGAGVYYGASRSEAAALAGERVVVVGGANSAGQAAVYFAKYAEEVVIVCRAGSLDRGMSHYLVEQIDGIRSISVRLEHEVAGFDGDSRLERLRLTHRPSGEEEALDAAAAFIFIGAQPGTAWLAGTVARDDRGFVLTGPDIALAPDGEPRWPLERPPLLLETSVPGVFAAGDVRHQSVKRVAAAVGDGSMSVQFVHQYLGTLG